MKKVFFILIISLFLSTYANSGPRSYYDGKGELILSKDVVNYFIKYIKKNLEGKKGDKPVIFWVTEDGNNAYWWTTDGNSCERTWDNEIYIVSRQGIATFGVADMCRGKQHIEKFGEECESFFGMECKIFAKQRIATWHNEINPGRGKESKFNSKWSDEQILSKLNELGFGFKEPVIKKTTSSKTAENDDLLGQLKTLKELYDSGALTKEEFEKAKKKILN